MATIAELKERFQQKYGRPADGVVQAPGRVNLIGEHTDYNDGFVLPIALERVTACAYALRDDREVHIASVQQEGKDTAILLDEPIAKGDPKWANYSKGVLAGMLERKVAVVGVDMLFDSDVPIGGGLSSSASLEVATGKAILTAAGQDMDGYELALLCQKAEHDYAGTPCGIMDQAISVLGEKGHALLLDCRDGSVRQVRFDDPDVVVLVCDTKVKHDLTDGGYAARRQQCYDAAAKLGVKMLRDATAEMVQECQTLTAKERMRARHVVGEIDRTLQAVDALGQSKYCRFGELMYGSHASLRDDYEVSCEELDAIVELARPMQGVYGARMTGGGFGGCAIILADASQADAIASAIGDRFEARFGHRCPIFATHAAQGACVVE